MDHPKYHPIWDIVKVVGVCAVCVSPFWFLAGDLGDGDEIIKTGVAAALVGVVTALPKLVSMILHPREPEKPDDQPGK